ncbi:alpha/beta fold hydrolase [Angustibacter aerolatus]
MTLAPRTHHLTADDGRRLGVHSLGSGPGVLVVHGAMQSGRSQLDLARLLGDDLEVHLLDRRGRGTSGPWQPGDADAGREVADVVAALGATGATRVLGISSGALLALRAAAATGPVLTHLAAFEPPLYVGDDGGSALLERLDRFDEAHAAGRLDRATAIAVQVSQMGPPWLFGLPTGVLALAARGMLRGGRGQGDPASALELATDAAAVVAVVRANLGRQGELAAVRARTLLLAGTRTRPYLRRAVQTLAEVVPGAERVDLDGTDHGATQNRSDRGRPEAVAPVLRRFLLEDAPATRR